MQREIVLTPKNMRILSTMGSQIKNARLRRRIPAQLVCERANISRSTLWAIEKGKPNVAIGHYVSVLAALNGMQEDFLLIAKDEELARKLEILGLKRGKRVR